MPTKISVVIPTYKRPDLLKKCLDALKEQSIGKSEYEVIVVSDGYDEVTKQLVLAYRLYSFKYLSLPEKKGPAAARNMGWRHADSRFVAFTDDDTIPHPNWLKAYLDNYSEDLAAAFTGKIKVPLPEAPTDYELNTANLEHAEFVTANCALTRTALEIVNGFDERFSMAWREDSDLEFKLLQQGVPIHHVPEALIVHPVRTAPWGVSIKEQKKGMFNALLYKKFPELYRQKIQPRPCWDYYVMVLAFFLLMVAMGNNYLWLALACALCYASLLGGFIMKRLLFTSRKRSHVWEMIATSVAIPFLSVYWQLYGAFKYRVLFL